MKLMTHVVVGYPSLAMTRKIALLMAKEGADFLELQIPFSDPLGDGSTIRRANSQSLDNGIQVRDAFLLARRLIKRDRIKIPILFMTYFNIPFTYGVEKFCKDANNAGVSGLLIPDYNLDMESDDKLEYHAKKNNLALIRFISLDSDAGRIAFLTKNARGFLYCFSTQGITGQRRHLDQRIFKRLRDLKKHTDLPLAVGFGISTSEHIRALRGKADIAVVGSALLRAFNDGGLEALERKMIELVKS
mgnify:CR=1 FL=1